MIKILMKKMRIMKMIIVVKTKTRLMQAITKEKGAENENEERDAITNCLKVPETRTKDEGNEVIGRKQKEGSNKEEEEEYTDVDDFMIDDDDRLIAEKRKKK